MLSLVLSSFNLFPVLLPLVWCSRHFWQNERKTRSMSENRTLVPTLPPNRGVSDLALRIFFFCAILPGWSWCTGIWEIYVNWMAVMKDSWRAVCSCFGCFPVYKLFLFFSLFLFVSIETFSKCFQTFAMLGQENTNHYLWPSNTIIRHWEEKQHDVIRRAPSRRRLNHSKIYFFLQSVAHYAPNDVTNLFLTRNLKHSCLAKLLLFWFWRNVKPAQEWAECSDPKPMGFLTQVYVRNSWGVAESIRLNRCFRYT